MTRKSRDVSILLFSAAVTEADSDEFTYVVDATDAMDAARRVGAMLVESDSLTEKGSSAETVISRLFPEADGVYSHMRLRRYRLERAPKSRGGVKVTLLEKY